MATPFNLHTFNSTASLANNATGTTFAAKARAAELNAVRSRKAAKDMEAEDEVPSVAPVPLGAIKFTKPRSRGKGWRSLNLEELPEESPQEMEQGSNYIAAVERSTPRLVSNPDYRSDNAVGQSLTYDNLLESQMLFRSSISLPSLFPEAMPASDPQKQEKMPVGYNQSVWDQDASPARTTGPASHPHVSSGHLTPQPPSRGSPALGPQGFSQVQDGWLRGKSTPDFPLAQAQSAQTLLLAQATKRPESNTEVRPSQRKLSSTEESKLEKLGVLPALQSHQTGSHIAERNKQGVTHVLQSQRSGTSLAERNRLGAVPALQPQQAGVYSSERNNHDDPFVGPSQATYSQATHPYTADQFFTSGLRSAGRPAAQAVKGTANYEFTYPPTAPINMSKVNLYPRDPMPYSSFSANKKDLLLRNLHEVVESSKSQGTLTNSSRTVLYDPVAHDPGKSAQPSPTEVAFKRAQETAASSHPSTGTGPLMLPQPDKETLKVSDPLPWTDRPVSIHNSTSPLAPQFPTLTVLPTIQPAPPRATSTNPDIWSLAQRKPPARLALEDVDAWWNDVHCREEFKFMLGTPTTRSGSGNTNTLDTPVHSAHQRVQDGSSGVGSLPSPPSRLHTDREVIESLMIPAMHTLASYISDASPGHFRRFARVPEWCIDKSAGGNQSFFGDWGVPPSRVGRDPRYRPTFHEGRYTVFEELIRRGGRDGMGRKYA